MCRLLYGPRRSSVLGRSLRARWLGSGALLLAVGWLVGLAAPPANARRRRRQRPRPRVMAPDAMAPFRGPLPSSGSVRHRPAPPAPLRIGNTGSRTGLDRQRRKARQLAANTPYRRKARRTATKAMRGRGGAVRVAILAASAVGIRAEEAAKVLAKKARITTLRRLIKHRDSRVRVGLARALAWRARLGPLLVAELLRDRSLRVLRAAVHTAARLGTKHTVGTLASLALRYDRSIRAKALQVLARHPKIKVAKRTVIRALTHRAASVRVDAVVAVGLARSEWSRYWLAQRARDRSVQVRRVTARALGRLAPKRSAFRLLARLRRDRSTVVKKAARRSLKQLRRAKRAARRASRRSRP